MTTPTAPEDRYALCVQNVSLGYGEKMILENINFCVEHRQIVTVLGGSGCGKTTLMKGLVGLLEPAKGRFEVYGKDISALGQGGSFDWVRKRTGVLFQSGALIGSLTLAENVALPIREFSNVPGDMVEEIVGLKLAMVRLGGYGGYYPAELSGGMKKRAGLARALALDPNILFCDEPTGGLDPIIAAQIDNLLLELNHLLAITMVVITHDLPTIMAISDRSIMLDADARGIIASGAPQQMENSSDPRVYDFFHRQAPRARL
ncbi:MAG: ATP-binding cassette domain-containing protein [Syntrophobacteraceae bacterium]|nr:ATP-binding cassette domain-containing protein [Syntrophobacteraceae bacterium]